MLGFIVQAGKEIPYRYAHRYFWIKFSAYVIIFIDSYYCF